MRYEEPLIRLNVPISLLRRMEESLFRDVSFAYDMSERGHRVNGRALNEAEQALGIIGDAIVNHEARLIIGESLSDDKLKREFPPEPKRRNKRKK